MTISAPLCEKCGTPKSAVPNKTYKVRFRCDPCWRSANLGRHYPLKDSPARSTVSKRIYYRRHPEKRVAHKAVAAAMYAGTLVALPCHVCGSVESEAHHDDYAKPLDIIWLCDVHHRARHLELRYRHKQTLCVDNRNIRTIEAEKKSILAREWADSFRSEFGQPPTVSQVAIFFGVSYATAWRRLFSAQASNPLRQLTETPAKSTIKNRRYVERNPEKHAAHKAVLRAVRAGLLQKAPCQVCGDACAEAHHDDYLKPLDVMWLCSAHHAARHVELRRLASGAIFEHAELSSRSASLAASADHVGDAAFLGKSS